MFFSKKMLCISVVSCSLWSGFTTSTIADELIALEVKAELANLGKRLFFDPRLSGDGTLSCSSCHQPSKGFTDGKALSDAYTSSLHFRNTPTLINTALKDNWFHDGRIGTNLNDVTREMITETYLMNMDMRLMQERVKQDPVYVEMFTAAGLGEPSNGGVRKAIPEFLKTLISRNSSHANGTMSEKAKRGEEIFNNKAGCNQCHTGELYSDGKSHNTGVRNNPEIWSDPLRHITYVTYAKFMGVENYMNIRRDIGAYVQNHKADGSNIGEFMTPTLRELKHTAPYMHNGTFSSLAEVVDFYNHGGGDDANKSPLLKPLGLTDSEESEIVSFLESLSGDPLVGEEFEWQDEIPTTYEAIANWSSVDN